MFQQMSDGRVKPKSWVGVSRMIDREETELAEEKKTLLDWVKEGDVERVGRLLGSDTSALNSKDEDVGFSLYSVELIVLVL